MNSLKVFGKYLDQPRLVSRFSRAVPPLLSLAASGIVLDSTYRAPEDKRQKVFIRNGLTMFGAVASSLYAPKIISKMFRTAPKLVKSKELKEYNTRLVDEFVSDNREEIVAFARRCGFPVVAKVVGPVHKSDVGGVVLNIKSEQHLALEFDRMMQIPDARAIMVQPMLKGTELFVGAKYEEKFGHVVLCGLGGIFVEVLKDVSSGLAPLSYEEAYSMIHSLRAYKIIQGTRGQKGVNEDKFAEIIVRLSTLLRFATEIKEMDINPLLATEKAVVAVDARIRIEK